jgi:hypothetical protein
MSVCGAKALDWTRSISFPGKLAMLYLQVLLRHRPRQSGREE